MDKALKLTFTYYTAIILAVSEPAHAMHIMEGFLPFNWALIWIVASLPFIVYGVIKINRLVKVNPRLKMLLVLAGAFMFVLSALKLPSITGSSSHPTGIGLGGILFGPLVMSVLGMIVLLFQALLLAHGGITTIGANVFAMGIIGPIIVTIVYKCAKKLHCPLPINVFLATFFGNLFVYTTTSLQLALAFPATEGGIRVSFLKFLGIFGITQIPLGISEAIITVLIFNFLTSYKACDLHELRIIPKDENKELDCSC